MSSVINVVNEEIKGEEIWNYIAKDEQVRVAVLKTISSFAGGIAAGVYMLEDESVSFAQRLVKFAEDGENVRFYVLKTVEDKKEE